MKWISQWEARSHSDVIIFGLFMRELLVQVEQSAREGLCWKFTSRLLEKVGVTAIVV